MLLALNVNSVLDNNFCACVSDFLKILLLLFLISRYAKMIPKAKAPMEIIPRKSKSIIFSKAEKFAPVCRVQQFIVL